MCKFSVSKHELIYCRMTLYLAVSSLTLLVINSNLTNGNSGTLIYSPSYIDYSCSSLKVHI